MIQLHLQQRAPQQQPSSMQNLPGQAAAELRSQSFKGLKKICNKAPWYGVEILGKSIQWVSIVVKLQ
jgi:hypothetical protein